MATAPRGRLVLVATPIGNLGDLSPRAVEVLRDAAVILCEDTRRTRTLLSAAGIRGAGRLEALHEHNETTRTPAILDAVASGTLAALVCDAGTPGISDPGQRLVAAAVASGLEVSTVPGPSALLAALVVSGLPTDRFVMEGFLPRRGAERSARLDALHREERTCVLFESPRRVAETLAALVQVLGPERRACVARELTKLHEEIVHGTLGELAARYGGVEVRGEVVLVLAGAAPMAHRTATDAELLAALAEARAGGLSTRDAVAEVASVLGVARRRAYELATRGAPEP